MLLPLKTDTLIDNTEYSFKSKKTSNWKHYQLRFMNAIDIDIDHKLKKFINSNSNWTFNIDFASPDIKNFVNKHGIKNNSINFDFFIINDLEFGKKPVSEIEHTLVDWYNISNNGGYFSFQSYYLNWNNQPNGLRKKLDDDMDVAVVQWVDQCLGISTYTNDSLTISDPLKNLSDTGELIAGSDFMYTHGNIRFWLWKQ